MSIWDISKRLGELFVVREEECKLNFSSRAGRLVVFLDESGDLSFKRGGSEWFVVGGVVTRDVRGVGTSRMWDYYGYRYYPAFSRARITGCGCYCVGDISKARVQRWAVV